MDRRSVLDKNISQNEVQRVPYTLVLVTYPLKSKSFSKDLQPFKQQLYILLMINLGNVGNFLL